MLADLPTPADLTCREDFSADTCLDDPGLPLLFTTSADLDCLDRCCWWWWWCLVSFGLTWWLYWWFWWWVAWLWWLLIICPFSATYWCWRLLNRYRRGWLSFETRATISDSSTGGALDLRTFSFTFFVCLILFGFSSIASDELLRSIFEWCWMRDACLSADVRLGCWDDDDVGGGIRLGLLLLDWLRPVCLDLFAFAPLDEPFTTICWEAEPPPPPFWLWWWCRKCGWGMWGSLN